MTSIKIELSSKMLRTINDDIVIEIDNIENGMTTGNPVNKEYVFTFMTELVDKLVERKKIRTSETYICALNSFKRFRNNTDISLSGITPDLIMEYESFLRDRHLSLNTCSFYMRIMRAMYNDAVRRELVTDCKPFLHVYTGNSKTSKRAVPLSSIEKIKHASVEEDSVKYARDLFLFSFYTRGMSFVDMAELKGSDIKGGVLTYRRKKTDQTLKIRWKQCMQDIVDRNPSLDKVHLLPIIDSSLPDTRRQYKAKQLWVNANLKKLSALIQLDCNLTMYVARHSWASIAKEMNIPIAIISDGMGHDSVKTTEIYLKSIDEKKIDEANDCILDKI